MAVYSINQVQQLYVATANSGNIIPTSPLGSIQPKVDVDRNLYFLYQGSSGVVRTDLVNLNQILYTKAIGSEDLTTPLLVKRLVLDTNVNGGNPVAGQDYVLRLVFRQFVGMSEEDMYFKYGAVRAYTGMTASDFYKTLALSVVQNMKRDVSKLLTVYLMVGTTRTEVTSTTDPATLTGTYTSIEFEQANPDWILGTFPLAYIPFEVQPTTISYNGLSDTSWGIVTNETPVTFIQNGRETADLEYFTLGARGDTYRNITFPNAFRPTYLVDSTGEYDYLNFHFYYTGSNESVQKSEKDLTIVAPNDGSHTVMNAIIAAINGLTSLAIPSL